MKFFPRTIACLFTATVGLCSIHAAKVAQPIQGAEHLAYKVIGGCKLILNAYFPEGHKRQQDQRPAVVFFFGGGWNGGSPSQFATHCEYLASRGMVAMTADYRVKSRQGTTPFDCVEDGKSAIRYVRQHAKKLGVDPNRIAAGGGSAGGHVAAATATVPGLESEDENKKISSKPDALILFNPVYDNGPKGYGYDRVKGRHLEISPIHNLRKGVPPSIVFLGDQDKLIPVSTAERFKSLAEKAGGRSDLHVYKNQPHGFFNQGKAGNFFAKTVFKMDQFLSSLGWLNGEPTIQVP